MNLADRIVALGVAESAERGDGMGYRLLNRRIWLSAEVFCHSWEVAGALMEKMNGACEWYCMNSLWEVYAPGSMTKSKSLPHAIILACVEALSERQAE